jgi:hypothetical protein
LGGRYEWRRKRITYALQLNIGNLLDDQKGESFISYANRRGGAEVLRRTEVYYGPRSYRLTLSAGF